MFYKMKNKVLISAFLVAGLGLQACKTAKVSTDNKVSSPTEKAMLKALQWQEANPIQVKSPTDWTNGAYYTGVARAHQSTKNVAFLNALTSMGKRNNWQPWERINNADDIAISYAYVYLKDIKKGDADLKPTADFIDKHFQWKKDQGAAKVLWYWCDALFMAPPVITYYAELTNNKGLLEDTYANYKQTYDILYDKEEHLFARDDRFVWTGASTDKKEKNGKKIFWSRGNGWVIGGLALMLDEMSKTDVHRPFYENLFKEMAVKIKSLQQPDGMWTTSLLSPESYNHSETSGSGFFTFALAWGVNNGLLKSEDYKPTIDKAWAGLMTVQKEDGKIGFVQNIGFDPRPATADSWQNYGTGAFLLAGSEVLKMK